MCIIPQESDFSNPGAWLQKIDAPAMCQRVRGSVSFSSSFTLVIIYHTLKAGRTYAELGGDFFDRLEPVRLTRYYVKHLEALGHKGTLEMLVAA